MLRLRCLEMRKSVFYSVLSPFFIGGHRHEHMAYRTTHGQRYRV